MVIIGGGVGGYVSAIKSAQSGLKAFLIEKERIGGVCLNWGCIPTKTLVGSAELLKNIQKADEFGIQVKDYSIDFSAIMNRKEMVSRRLSSGVEQLMKANRVNIIKGNGQILKPGIIEVTPNEGEKEIVKAKNIIIATGSKSMKVPIPGIENEGVMTSNGALSLAKLPDKMIIIGGGVVGIEFACIYNAFGVDVTVIEMLPRILFSIDEEIVGKLALTLKRKGIKVFTHCMVKKIKKNGKYLEVYISTSEREQKLETEKVLAAMGRVPDTGNINIQGIGIELDGKAIKVDETMRTNISGIYAVGDVVGKVMLAHVAAREGIVAVENILGNRTIMDYRFIPNCVFSSPEVASVGLTESEAREKYSNIKVSKFPYVANGKALAMGEKEGMVKMIAQGDSNEILGVHIFGAHASDLIAEGTLSLSLEATAEEIATTIHAHPTLTEMMAEAAEGIIGKPIHIFRR